MHMICSSMLIPASTELTEFSCISCRKKITAPPFAWGHMPPLPPLPAATVEGSIPYPCYRLALRPRRGPSLISIFRVLWIYCVGHKWDQRTFVLVFFKWLDTIIISGTHISNSLWRIVRCNVYLSWLYEWMHEWMNEWMKMSFYRALKSLN